MLKSKKSRLVVRVSNRYVLAQIVNYSRDGDETIASANSKELEKLGFFGGKNIPGCYLTGYLIGKKAAEKGVIEAILDTGLQTAVKKGRIFSVQKGANDAGLNVLHGKEVFPSEEMIKGKDIEEFAKKLSEEEFKKRFSWQLSKGFDVRGICSLFEKTKANIDEKFSKKKGA